MVLAPNNLLTAVYPSVKSRLLVHSTSWFQRIKWEYTGPSSKYFRGCPGGGPLVASPLFHLADIRVSISERFPSQSVYSNGHVNQLVFFFSSLSFLFVLYSFCFVQSASLDKCKHQAIPLLSALAAVLYWVDVWTHPIYCCTQWPTVLLSISDARSTPDPRWYQEPSSMCLFTSWFCCLFFGREIWIRLHSGQVHTFYDFCCIEFFSFCPNLLIVS